MEVPVSMEVSHVLYWSFFQSIFLVDDVLQSKFKVIFTFYMKFIWKKIYATVIINWKKNTVQVNYLQTEVATKGVL